MQLLCVGDVALADGDLPRDAWVHLLGRTSDNETRILLNWELPIGETLNPTPRSSGPRLLAHPASLRVIQAWAPGFATLATNHILDGGEEGLANTITSLNHTGFTTVGAGRTEEEIQKTLFWETAEGRLAIVNWVFPETHPDWMAVPGPNCWPGLDGAKHIVQALKGEADWVMIVVHWGDENFSYPHPEDRAIARELAHMGVDLIIGHHPHVVRGMEMIAACPVFYSLGNFHLTDFSEPYAGYNLQSAPRNREGLGVFSSFQRGRRLDFRTLSFWQAKGQVIADPFGRAHCRMMRVSQPLRRFQNSSYDGWYKTERARFDKWGARWHFGVRRLGIRGLVRYARRHQPHKRPQT